MAITEYGKPLEELALPEPPLEPGYALLQVDVCGVCQSDVKVSRGGMPFSSDVPLPHVPGHEICGRVLKAGPRCDVEEGTRVIVMGHLPCRRCSYCTGGRGQLCPNLDVLGFTKPGGFQERIVAPLENLVTISPDIDPVVAAPIGCAIGTAYRATVTRGNVRPGMRVAVLGLGGVGMHALQLVKLAGAFGVGLDVSRATVGATRELGLDALMADDPEVEERVIIETGDGEGVDVVIDAVGHPATLDRASRVVRKGGRIVVVGYDRKYSLSIPSDCLALDELEVMGSRNTTRAEVDQVIRLISARALNVVIDSVRPLERVNEALNDLEAGRIVGRTVLRIGQ